MTGNIVDEQGRTQVRMVDAWSLCVGMAGLERRGNTVVFRDRDVTYQQH